MESRTEQLRNLAKVIHDMRPNWHTNGIMRVLEDDDRPVDRLRAIALAAAQDPTARGPGVIATRDEPTPAAMRPPSQPLPPNIRDVLAAPKQPDEVARRGAALCREALADKGKDPDEW